MVYKSHRKSFLPYCKLSRHRQRDAFIRLRWRILRETPLYGGMFSSHLILDEPGRPNIYRQWFDFSFLGLDGHNIWNAAIITGSHALWERVDDLAWEQTQSRLTETELEAEFRMKTEPAHCVGVQKFRRITLPEPRRYAALDNMTFREYQQRITSEILRGTPPDIHESYHQDHTYRYGTGLEIVMDAPVIDRGSIEHAILRFRELGEGEWRGSAPIPRDHLPEHTYAEALAAWGKQSATTKK